ncbi:DUF349 domain-containing protein [Pontimonas sp.]|jgi:hypothetical protein|uniref:DUF349 domain-containing protein n=1 Tax=Pontimonas sp. TaxID=2304492 RepID=UPI00287078D6|nr:DUF349 domain-containing protein [Pontimonas sp.]MDR9434020.1 DUF349 domain-containing protein [Pontimonas sp.]
MEDMVETTHPWGRVTDSGTVEVRIGDEWHAVGAYPDGTPEEAMALFVRKFADLESQVKLAEDRHKAGAPAKDIQKSVTALQSALETPSAVGDLESLKARVATLAGALGELAAQQSKEREAAVAAATEEREKIVVEIEALASGDLSQVRWKDTTAKVDALFESWKTQQQEGPKLPKATADALWKRFRNARHTLDRARRSHFQARDKLVKEAKGAKRELIEQAQGLAEKGAAGIPAYRELLEAWKKAPRATRAIEDQLWAQFKAAGDVLYQAKTAQVAAEDEANRENGEQKAALIEEFSDILTLTDHRQGLERIRLFHERSKKIGPVPRAQVKALDAKVAAFDKHVKKLEAEHWDKSNPEKQARSESFLNQIDEDIERLQGKKSAADAAGNAEEAERIQSELDTKLAWRTVLTDA